MISFFTRNSLTDFTYFLEKTAATIFLQNNVRPLSSISKTPLSNIFCNLLSHKHRVISKSKVHNIPAININVVFLVFNWFQNHLAVQEKQVGLQNTFLPDTSSY